uniref:Uncharacterized protein n=1 Tax=Romanomermis culicivorax TaxID=13658 RepID=A0A915HW43_ROMCU
MSNNTVVVWKEMKLYRSKYIEVIYIFIPFDRLEIATVTKKMTTKRSIEKMATTMPTMDT